MTRAKFEWKGDGLPGLTEREATSELGQVASKLLHLGKPGAVVLLICGVPILVFGLSAIFHTWHGIVPLSLGGMLCAMAISILRHPNFRELAGEISLGKQMSPTGLLHEVETHALPFWLCTACNVFYLENECFDRCANCGKTADLIHVVLEPDRDLAKAAIVDSD